MAVASGQNVVIGMKAESQYGSVESGTDYVVVPFNSVSLSLAKTTHESAVINGNRDIQDVIMGAHSVTGDITFHLAHQPAYIDMFEGLLGDTTASSGAYGVGLDRQSYTIQQSFDTDLAGGNDNHQYTGCEINSFNMTIPADGLIECSFGIIGATMATATASTDTDPDNTGANYVETNNPFHSSQVTITEGAANSITTDLSLTIENGISTSNRVGSNIPIKGGIGKCRVTGSMTCHFTSDALLAKFIDNTASSLTISMGSTTTGLSFSMPKIIYTTGAVEVTEGLLSVAVDFVAVSNNGASTITIDTDLS